LLRDRAREGLKGLLGLETVEEDSWCWSVGERTGVDGLRLLPSEIVMEFEADVGASALKRPCSIVGKDLLTYAEAVVELVISSLSESLIAVAEDESSVAVAPDRLLFLLPPPTACFDLLFLELNNAPTLLPPPPPAVVSSRLEPSSLYFLNASSSKFLEPCGVRL
jgi:hypothetical protein